MNGPSVKTVSARTKSTAFPPAGDESQVPERPIAQAKKTEKARAGNGSDERAKLLERYGCGPIQFAGSDDAFYERHLLFDNVVGLEAAGPRERFEALARTVRDVLSQRWVRTEETYARK